MHRRRRSTRARLTLTSTSAFGVAMVMVSTLAWLALSAQTMSQLDVSLTSELQAAKSELSAYAATASQHKDPPSTGTSLTTLIHDGTAVNLTAWSGNRFVASSSGGDRSAAAHQWAIANDPGAGGEPVMITTSLDGGGLRALVAHVQTRSLSATLLLTTSLSPYISERWQSGLTLALTVVLVTALAALVSYRIAAAALKPIHRLSVRARDITEHNIDRPLSVAAPDDEVGELAATLENMRQRLASSFDDQRRLRADAAHELRTPLAMLQAEIEVTLGRGRSPEEYRESLRSLLRDAGHLNEIVTRLLLVSRAESHALNPKLTPVDVTPVVEDAVRRATSLRRGDVETALVRPLQPSVISGNETMLRQALDNVLANAVRHARHRVAVRVAHENADGLVVLSVEDDGPGIPAESRQDVLKPFRRLDSGRSRDDGGSGLGLAVTNAIVATHGGVIRLGESPSGGAAVWLEFPLLSESAQSPGGQLLLSAGRRDRDNTRLPAGTQ